MKEERAAEAARVAKEAAELKKQLDYQASLKQRTKIVSLSKGDFTLKCIADADKCIKPTHITAYFTDIDGRSVKIDSKLPDGLKGSKALWYSDFYLQDIEKEYETHYLSSVLNEFSISEKCRNCIEQGR